MLAGMVALCAMLLLFQRVVAALVFLVDLILDGAQLAPLQIAVLEQPEQHAQ